MVENEVGLFDSAHGLDVPKITALFELTGYECAVKGKLRGASGEAHEFDFVAKRSGERLVIQGFELYDTYSDELEMIKLRVKTLDACPDTCVVIFHMTCPESMRKMVKEFNYVLIEPTNSKTAYQLLEEFLRASDS